MKKFLKLFVAVLIMVSVSACSGGGSSAKLKVWFWDPNINGAAITKAQEAYNKANPDAKIDIELVEMARADLQTKLTTIAMSGDKAQYPDVILLGDDVAPMYLSLYENSFVALDGKIDYANFPAYKVAGMTKNDKRYGVPFDNAVSGMYCRTDMLEKAGYKASDLNNLTYSQFTEIGKNITSKTGVKALTWSAPTLLRNLVHSAGADYTDADGKIYLTKNEAAKAGLQTMRDMMAAGFVYDAVDWTDYVNSVTSGSAACTISGAWFVPTITGMKDTEGKWAVVSVPRLDNVKNAANATAEGGSSWYIMAGNNSDAATKFLAETFAKDTALYETLLTDVGAMGTYLPAQNTKAFEEEVKYFGGQKIYSQFMDWSSKVPSYVITEDAQAAQDAIGTVINDVLTGKMSVTDALTKAQTQAESSTK